MLEKPLVSVIIPIYETEKYIERAVQSVLNQTYQRFEIILVNDGSPDHSEQVCEKLLLEDARVSYYWQENQGVAAARNLGMEKATGEYLLFLDSDDTWDVSLLEKVVSTFEKNCDMVRFNFKSMAPEVLESDQFKSASYSCKELFLSYFGDGNIYRNISSCCFGAYKRSIVEKNHISFDTRLVHGEDGTFVVRYGLACKNIEFLEDKLYEYYPLFEERINATARNIKALYDEYELCLMQFTLLYDKFHMDFTEAEKRVVYGDYINRTIGRLVRFAVYTPGKLLSKNMGRLNDFLNDATTEEAIKYYVPRTKSSSKLIPFFVERKNVLLLWLILRSKKKKYYLANGKKKFIQSIWKTAHIKDE